MANVAALRDFIANPILVKETHRTSRSFRTFLPFYLMMVFLSFGLLLLMVLLPSREDIRFALIIPFIPGCLALLRVLGISCSSISDELKHHTYDLLRITRLNPWEIVWGKLTAALVPAWVAVAASLPLTAICVLLGCADIPQMLYAYFSLFVAAVGVAAFGVMLSALIKNTVVAMVAAVAILLFCSSSISAALVAAVAFGMKGAGGAPPAALVMAMRGMAIHYLVFPVVFFFGAVALLSPPSANRSTALRICYVVIVFARVAWLCIASQAMPTAMYALPWLIIDVAAPGVLAAVLFCGESASLSERLRNRYGQHPASWKIFVPGRATAAVLVRAVTAVAAAVFVIFIAASGSGASIIIAAPLALCIVVYVHFCCTIATAMRSFWDSSKSRILTLIAIAAFMVAPLFLAIFLNHDDARTVLASTNPFVLIVSTFEEGANARPPSGLFAGFVAVHLLASLVIFIARRSFELRKTRQAPPLPVFPAQSPSGG